VVAFDKASSTKLPINYESWEVQRWYANTISLQNYLKLNNIRYVMYNSLQSALKVSANKKEDHNMLRKAVDPKKFFKVDYSQYQYCSDIGQFISDKDHHPNEIGHRSWAKEITNFIEENKLYEI
jgi:hypothetical protein